MTDAAHPRTPLTLREEGPCLDPDSGAMPVGGGSLMLGTTGRIIGPGDQEPVKTDHGDRPANRYYDGDVRGVAKLQLSPVRWSADGWPEFDPLPQSGSPFPRGRA